MRLFLAEELIKCDMLGDPVSAILDGAGITVRCAPPPLRRYLGCFWEFAGERAVAVETFPDGCAHFIVELAPGARPQAFIVGPRSTPGRYAKPAGMKVLGVRLRPGVGYLLLRKPMFRLLDRRLPYPAPAIVSLDEMEAYVSQRLQSAPVDARVSAAVRTISESSGDARIDEVARQSGAGRHLERLMRTWVGYSPKRLARVARFQALLGSVDDSPPRDWTSLAAESYADQAHLIREFSEFAGASPRRFYAARHPDATSGRCGF